MPKSTFFWLHPISLVFLTLLIIGGTAPKISAQAILAGDRSVPVEAQNGMVVTSHTLATQVALQVLK